MIDTSRIARLNIKQAAELMNCSPDTVRRRIDREGLRCYRFGDKRQSVRLSLADIIEWQERHKVNNQEDDDFLTPEKAIRIAEKAMKC